MSIEVLAVAKQEFEDAAFWYELQEEGLGLRFQSAVSRALDQIAEHPEAWASEPDLRLGGRVRRYIMEGYPYSLVYATRPRLMVLAIAHVRRRPDYWIERTRRVH